MLSRFTRAFKEFSRKLISAEKVGVDGAGNQYYREPKFSDGLGEVTSSVICLILMCLQQERLIMLNYFNAFLKQPVNADGWCTVRMLS